MATFVAAFALLVTSCGSVDSPGRSPGDGGGNDEDGDRVQKVSFYWRSGLPDITDIAYGNGKFVAVTEDARILVSDNGVDWSFQPYDPGVYIGRLRGVVFAEGTFVAAGGQILASPDGENWRLVYSRRYGAGVKDLKYIDGRFVAVGSSGRVYLSPDGINWSEYNVGASVDLVGVAGSGDLMVAVGLGGEIYASTSGEKWFLKGALRFRPKGVIYAEGKRGFLVVGEGNVAFSADGENWATASVGDVYLESATEFDEKYLAVGRKAAVLISADGVHWNPVDLGDIKNDLLNVEYFPEHRRLIAVGRSGVVLLSTDAFNWEKVTDWGPSCAVCDYRGITYGSAGFIAVGGAHITSTRVNVVMKSPDGFAWERISTPTSYPFNAVTYGNGMYIAIDDSGKIFTSTDGFDWRKANLSLDGQRVTRIRYIQEKDVFALTGTKGLIAFMAKSADVIESMSNLGTFHITDIAYGNGKFVAVTEDARILVSDNGVDWSFQPYDPGVYIGRLRGVVFAEGTFVAAGGQILASPDGENWRLVYSRRYGAGVKDLKYIDGRFVAVGSSGRVYLSPDGINWSEYNVGASVDLVGVAGSGDLMVAVGHSVKQIIAVVLK